MGFENRYGEQQSFRGWKIVRTRTVSLQFFDLRETAFCKMMGEVMEAM
jgi:hypothetical protein